MSTETTLCNRALASMGSRSTITSISEDSPEAIQCRLWFDATRDEMLRMALWNFARRTQALSLLKALPGTPENTTVITSSAWSTDWPQPPWLYEYAEPSDCVFMRFILGQYVNNVSYGVGASPLLPLQGTPRRFLKAGSYDPESSTFRKVILTNSASALGIYTMRVTNPQMWDDLFVSAFVAVLAAKLSIPLSGDKDIASANYNIANGAITEARARDGNEGWTQQDIEPDWIAARTGYGGAILEVPDAISLPQLYMNS